MNLKFLLNRITAVVLLLLTVISCEQKEQTSDNPKINKTGEVLPFPMPPSASTYGETIYESDHKRRAIPNHLADDAPNIVIVLMDDVGFGSASTFGGEVNTPTLSRLFENGIAYNEFHTTAICSPTRAALLTGRNHTRVGSGTIAERAGVPAVVTIAVDGKEAAICQVERTVRVAFSATETFDVGVDLGAPVSLTYRDQAPFEYDGVINSVKVEIHYINKEIC